MLHRFFFNLIQVDEPKEVLNVSISKIIDKYLPSDGDGTPIAKKRQEMYDNILQLVKNQNKYIYMEVNNFEAIKKLLVFDNDDTFYHCQILKRKKENSEIGSNSTVIKTYYIGSIEYLDKKTAEIISLCNVTNARACINLNRRSYEKMAMQTVRKLIEQMLNKDFDSAHKAYDSCCGAYGNEPKNKWIIDIDEVCDLDFIIDSITECDPNPGEPKLITTLPTKNGCHIITYPFNVMQLKQDFCLDLCIQKNNPTILYCNTIIK